MNTAHENTAHENKVIARMERELSREDSGFDALPGSFKAALLGAFLMSALIVLGLIVGIGYGFYALAVTR